MHPWDFLQRTGHLCHLDGLVVVANLVDQLLTVGHGSGWLIQPLNVLELFSELLLLQNFGPISALEF